MSSQRLATCAQELNAYIRRSLRLPLPVVVCLCCRTLFKCVSSGEARRRLPFDMPLIIGRYYRRTPMRQDDSEPPHASPMPRAMMHDARGAI